jgi:hypothetical protein
MAEKTPVMSAGLGMVVMFPARSCTGSAQAGPTV